MSKPETARRTGWPPELFMENLRHAGDEADGLFAAYIHDAADEIERLRDALFTAQRRFELFVAGGVEITNGASPRVGAQEAKSALRGWRPD